jgi:hypothetical protein
LSFQARKAWMLEGLLENGSFFCLKYKLFY